MPNVDHIRQWHDALLSGKYKQGFGQLRKGNAYCCLGVAAEIAKVPRVKKGDLYEYGANQRVGVLPEEAQGWLGIDEDDPIFALRGCASSVNDYETPFKEIAELIRLKWPEAFEDK